MPTNIQILDATKTLLIDMAGGTVPVYLGEAAGVQPTYELTGVTVSTANPAEITSVAHGLNTDNSVIISGATGAWAGLNGVRKITRTGADTFTVAVDSSGYALTFNGIITTTAPRTSAACWRILKNYYDGTPNLIRTSFAKGGGYNSIYDNRAALLYS